MTFRSLFAKRFALALTAPVLFLLLLEALCTALNIGHPTRFLITSSEPSSNQWIDNQLFGYRFFSASISRAPTPIVIPKDKQDNELRVVILGESAAMGEPEPAFGPARMLELMLQDSYPEKDITVINAAMTAINSHVIVEIARDLKRMQPDIVICYIGNNEVVGPYGPGTVFSSFSASRTVNRLRAVATRLKLTSAIRSRLNTDHEPGTSHWQGMEMFVEHLIAPDDPRLLNVYENYRSNLKSIVKQIRTSGALPMISTVAVNLGDQAPLDGTVAPCFLPGSTNRTLSAFKAARDADKLRFRADSRINGIIREVSESSGATLIDTEAHFEQQGVPGSNYFLDHVHFNLAGAYEAARLFYEASRERLNDSAPAPLSREEISERIGWNPFSALEITELMRNRYARPPFTAASDHTDQMIKWSKETAAHSRQNIAMDTDALLHRLLPTNTVPADTCLLHIALRIQLFNDRFAEAEKSVNLLLDALPHRADIRSWKTIIRAANGAPEEAYGIMTEHGTNLGGLPADMLASASETLFESGFRQEAIVLLRQAAEHFPNRIRIRGLLATRLAQTGDINEAMNLFSQLLDDHPDVNWLREEYGLLLAVSGNPAKAAPYFDHLIDAEDPDQQLKFIQYLLFSRDISRSKDLLDRLLTNHPDHAPTHRLLSTIAIQTGDYARGIDHLREALKLEPWRDDDFVRLGTLFDSINQPRQALSAYETALLYSAEPADIMRSMAWMCATESQADIHNPQRALRIIDRLIELYPQGLNDPYTRHVRAAALAANRDFPQAIQEIDQALAITPKENDVLISELKRARQLYGQSRPIRINRDQDRDR